MASQLSLDDCTGKRPCPRTRKISKDIDVFLKKKRIENQKKAYKAIGLDRAKCMNEVKTFIVKKKKR